MPIDPGAQLLLDVVNAGELPPIEEMTPEEARVAHLGLVALQGEAPEGTTVEERDIAGVPCQVITPDGGGPWPVLVWIHGGGWVIGRAAESTITAQRLAVGAGCVVVNVDYRLAPEHPFPAAPDDCSAVAHWVLVHAAEIGGDPARVAVGGDSAGGNLSAVVANEVPGLLFQLLVYPVVDVTFSSPSMEENAEGYLLTKASMEWFAGHYLAGGGDPKDPRVSPLLAPLDVLAGAPPALVITAELDPLRDEGEAYAARLAEAGVEATCTRYDGQIHAFFVLPAVIPEALVAVGEAAHHLRAAFGTS